MELPFFKVPTDTSEVHAELRRFYWDELDNPLFKLKPPDSPGLFVTWRGWRFVEEHYPLLEAFRAQHDLAHLLIFFEMDDRWWEDAPHSHNTKTGGSILFPIHRTSDDIITQFYRVLEPSKINNPADSQRYGYLEYTGDTELMGQFHLLEEPYVIDVNIFHKPVLLTTPDRVNGRVICNWKAKKEVVDMAQEFGYHHE